MTSTLSYVPLTSLVSPSFWSKLSELKLDVFKLNEMEQHLWGYTALLDNPNCPLTLLEVDSTSFNVDFCGQSMNLLFHGKLINTNTIERFKEYDKMHLINSEGIQLYEKIQNGEVLKDPSLLNRFILLSFADIKKYLYYYWFAFPVPKGLSIEKIDVCNITQHFSDEMLRGLYCDYRNLDDQQKGYFMILRKENEVKIYSLESTLSKLPVKDSQTYFGFFNIARGSSVGSQLRNFVLLILHYWIAENSVDLNLKLMKWNLLPAVDLEKLKRTKCLLLGSGTLGCSVARTLLGWGIRNVTFVDNATVSFSNPVRQSLFTYQDSVEAKPKSKAAADGLRRIFPGVISKSFQMTIPMPGHPVGESFVQQTTHHVQKLIELIDEHDVIFLLMDSRESRWLPTLLGTSQQKLVINAALGFDSYLVMRHGIYTEDIINPQLSHPEGFKSIPGNNLGCYFCNDVTAPGDSMKHRTLDQQCTVTRPGVSQIAGALAAELAVSLLQHNEGILAPAFYSSSSQNANNLHMENLNPSILGLVPHSIRGFLSSLEQFLPATQKYKNCVACSQMIVKEYREKGMAFLFEVFSSSKHLEDVAMLTDMYKEMNMDEILEFNDEEDFACSSVSSNV